MVKKTHKKIYFAEDKKKIRNYKHDFILVLVHTYSQSFSWIATNFYEYFLEFNLWKFVEVHEILTIVCHG